MTYSFSVFKRNTELVLMSPFILAGKLYGYLLPLKTRHRAFLFFSSADIGGAIRVNADITHCIREQKPLIIFSKKPKNNQFRHLFDIEGVRIIDLHRYIDCKWYHFVNIFYRGVISAWINREKNPLVFGGECLYFYKIIPHIRKKIRKVELCHLNTWFNFSQAFVAYMDARIFSTQKIKRDAAKQYTENNVPVMYHNRLHFIDNKIDIHPLQESANKTLQVVYVGRGAPQKRVHLIAAIAKKMHEQNKPVHFSFVGEVSKIVSPEVQAYCTMYGNIREEEKLHSIYQQSDVLLLTSLYEGLPLAIMEMMARGKVVISTAVDSIPDYISHGENGLLITETDEEKIVESGVQQIETILKNPGLKQKIGEKSRLYAEQHFSGEVFCQSYRKIFELPAS